MQSVQRKGEYEMAATEFSTILQGLRKEKKVTQEQLATYLGVSPQAVSKWENGSYPEGDLLPKIADYFGVSIDYLYGRAEKECRIEQKMLEYFKDVIKQELDKGTPMSEVSDLWEKLLATIWAGQISPWSPNREYFDRMISGDETATSASIMMNNSGYSYMNLDKDNGFYFMMKKPDRKEGYARWLLNSKKEREFFKVLSSEDNVKVLLYLYSLGWSEFVNPDTVSKAVGVPEDKVRKLLEYLVSDISENNYGHYPLNQIKVATGEGEPQVAYGVDQNLGGLLFGLFTLANSYVYNPMGYSMQISNRTETWVKRDIVTGK